MRVEGPGKTHVMPPTFNVVVAHAWGTGDKLPLLLSGSWMCGGVIAKADLEGFRMQLVKSRRSTWLSREEDRCDARLSLIRPSL